MPLKTFANSLKKTNPSSSLKANRIDQSQYLYLTTRGRKSGCSREIEIWFTQCDGRVYVVAEYDTSHWLQNLRAHPEVGVRLGEQRFRARARVLDPDTDTELRHTIQELSREKYGWGDGTVVELESLE
jgi:deazaflavin-dependent oxidoreductase (nitroreductase family)